MNQIKSLLHESSQSTRISRFLVTGDKTAYFVVDAAAIVKFDMSEYQTSGYSDDNGHASSRRERLSADPKKLAALRKARRRIAGEIEDRSSFALVKLRLNAGLSQAELAAAIGTQQPAIARLEKGEVEPNLTTIAKLATALGVASEAVFHSFMNAKEVRTAK